MSLLCRLGLHRWRTHEVHDNYAVTDICTKCRTMATLDVLDDTLTYHEEKTC